jgi:hypothetical protein
VNKTDAYNNVMEPSLAANLVLLVTLVLFQFPFMNGYIVYMYDTCVIARTDWRRLLLCLWLVVMQFLGVVIAWLVVKFVGSEWDDAITWMSPEADAKDVRLYVDAVEEFFAVTALLVGYIHLTYLNFEFDKQFKLFKSDEHLFSAFSTGTKQLAIPLPFIMQVTLLVAGLLRAFPTAHLSPHISLYLALMKYTTWGAFGMRMLGGILAFAFANRLFWGATSKEQGCTCRLWQQKRMCTCRL